MTSRVDPNAPRSDWKKVRRRLHPKDQAPWGPHFQKRFFLFTANSPTRYQFGCRTTSGRKGILPAGRSSYSSCRYSLPIGIGFASSSSKNMSSGNKHACVQTVCNGHRDRIGNPDKLAVSFRRTRCDRKFSTAPGAMWAFLQTFVRDPRFPPSKRRIRSELRTEAGFPSIPGSERTGRLPDSSRPASTRPKPVSGIRESHPEIGQCFRAVPRHRLSLRKRCSKNWRERPCPSAGPGLRPEWFPKIPGCWTHTRSPPPGRFRKEEPGSRPREEAGSLRKEPGRTDANLRKRFCRRTGQAAVGSGSTCRISPKSR